ncbi:MAG: CapA family protein [Clostridia bacterium]|nr:CapA family protein [Clostridia bacterium]
MRKFIIALLLVLTLTSCVGEEPIETTEAPVTTAELTLMTEATLEPEPEPVLYKFSFIAAGDNMAYYGNIRDAKRNAEGTDMLYDFRPSYTSIKPLVEAHDLSFINQETLMCGEGFDLSYYPRFNSPQELGDAVVDAGFDIVGLANNHMLDKGEKGLLATFDYWEKQPVTTIGGYRNREAFDDITVIEQNGITIALLSFTYATNGLSLPASSEVYIPYIDNEEVAAKVREAETLADITIVSMHWGNEFTFKVNAQQTEAAQIICDNGGDVIIGHHPHCIQPVEWIESEGNRTLCVYSLGNFMSEMERDYKILGGMISFEVEKLGEDGKAEVKNPVFIPTVFDYTRSFYNNHIYLLENYTAEQAKSHGMAYYGNYTTLETLIGYVKKNISEEFLPEFLKDNVNE